MQDVSPLFVPLDRFIISFMHTLSKSFSSQRANVFSDVNSLRLPVDSHGTRPLPSVPSKRATFTIRLFQMINYSTAYLHCDLSVCLRNHSECERVSLNRANTPRRWELGDHLSLEKKSQYFSWTIFYFSLLFLFWWQCLQFVNKWSSPSLLLCQWQTESEVGISEADRITLKACKQV